MERNVEDEIVKEILKAYKAGETIFKEEIIRVCKIHSFENYNAVIERLRLKGLQVFIGGTIGYDKPESNPVYQAVHNKYSKKKQTKADIEVYDKTKISSKSEVVDLHSNRDYNTTIPEFIKYRDKVIVESRDWTEIYVGIMTEFAKTYHSKIASWCGYEDVYNSNKKYRIPKKAILKEISPVLLIDVNFSADDIVSKIYKFASICNIDSSEIKIGIKTTKKAPASFVADSNSTDRKIKNLNSDKYDLSEILELISSELTLNLEKQKAILLETLDDSDYEHAMVSFKSAWLNSNYLKTMSMNLRSMIDEINNNAVSDSLGIVKKYDSIDEIIDSMEKLRDEKKECLHDQIEEGINNENKELISYNVEIVSKINNWIMMMKEFRD